MSTNFKSTDQAYNMAKPKLKRGESRDDFGLNKNTRQRRAVEKVKKATK